MRRMRRWVPWFGLIGVSECVWCGICAVRPRRHLARYAGVDVELGQIPSKMEMFRLMMKKEIRESATTMAMALQEAGIDLRSPVRRNGFFYEVIGLCSRGCVCRR